MAYIQRTIEETLKKAANEFPVVVLTGPRQSGKTTVLQHLFSAAAGHVSLEAPDIRDAATRDPRGFLTLHPPPVIIDEVQYAADLLPYIKKQVDENRARKGQFFLTGSQNLLLLPRVSESLAGMAAVLHLLPFSGVETSGNPWAVLPWEAPVQALKARPASASEPWADLLRGSYPEIVTGSPRDIRLWHAGYVQTYLEQDVRQLTQVGDLGLFHGFLRALAARSGQLLNLSAISRELGIALNTAKRWLSILEATFQVTVLRPYHVNAGKRLVKAPKAYFTDTGTLCYLLGIRNTESAASDMIRGPLFETFVLSELLKSFIHRGEQPPLFFWRTSHGVEVDFVIDNGLSLIPIEVKATATPRYPMADGIRAFRTDYGNAGAGFVVHLGSERVPMGEGTTAIPCTDISRGMAKRDYAEPASSG